MTSTPPVYQPRKDDDPPYVSQVTSSANRLAIVCTYVVRHSGGQSNEALIGHIDLSSLSHLFLRGLSKKGGCYIEEKIMTLVLNNEPFFCLVKSKWCIANLIHNHSSIPI